jgi:DNA-binding transcriptional LysR family regulator
MQDRNAKAVPRLPSLDLLTGFEAAARLLSFTKAGAELYLSQSAVSRQIQELEQQLGVPLFQRRHRSLALTAAGQQLFSAAAQVLATMRLVTDRLRADSGRRVLSVTTMASFAALWLVPRLAGFARDHPGVDVRIATEPRMQDLEREGLDVGIRYCTAAEAGEHAVRLFGERVFPVCSPKLAADPKRPLREPADLRQHVLLQYDDPEGHAPWLNWKSWLELVGLPDLRPAGSLVLSGYEQIIPAAVAGQGVALGRSPLVRELIATGKLVKPFTRASESSRAYFALASKNAAGRVEVDDFLRWLRAEAAREEAVSAISRDLRAAKRKAHA